MADRKLERRTILDPAVAGLLNDMENRQSDAALPRRPSGPMDLPDLEQGRACAHQDAPQGRALAVASALDPNALPGAG